MTTTLSAPHGADARAVAPKRAFALLTLGCLGVVYGDIGTSPLYALQVSLTHVAVGANMRAEVIGLVSLLVWALIFIVTAKYILFVMRMDNKGEGGTLSLMALAQQALGGRTSLLFVLGIAGAALFYGDAILTPAISVLSAIEGVELAVPAATPYVIPLTLTVLAALFAVQSRGTAKVGAFFGPITLVWFAAIALLGIRHLADDPAIFLALNPLNGLRYLLGSGHGGFLALGAVFLAVTGGEALYADMGHFGRKPITWAWSGIVLPALLLNYLGQGAMVLAHPETASNPFYLMVPPSLLVPMILLATAATVIASQAVISGTFSLTQQAIQLGLLPRIQILHTSETQAGQIFMPRINMLLFGVVILVLAFKSSTALASAYGIAVSGTMLITTPLAFLVAWKLWRWPLHWAALACAPFALVDAAFFAANAFKFLDGGYVPVAFALALMLIMWTWSRGVRGVNEKQRRASVPLDGLMKSLARSKPAIVPGTAVFLTTTPDSAPAALLHNLKHNRVLHEKNIVLTIKSANVPRILLAARKFGLHFDIMQTSFFLSRFNLKSVTRRPLKGAQDKLFIWLTRTANDATDFLQIPPGRVVWLGGQLTI